MHLVPKFSRRDDLIHHYVGRLDTGRFSSSLCYLDHNPGDGNEEVYPVHFMGSTHRELRRFSFSLVRRLGALIDSEEIDLVHCHRHKGALYGTLAARRSRRDIPVVITVHGMGRTRTFLRRLTNRLLFPRITRILAVSKAVRNDILQSNPRLDPAKVRVVYNGIDTSRFPLRRNGFLKMDRPVFGTMGRLVPTKGYDLLLRAFAEVLSRVPEAVLKIAGVGPLKGCLKEEVRRLGIEGKVHFVGFRNDVAVFLEELDFFVLPSLAEGLPLALLEAMAVGVPVIASDAGGIPEVLSDPVFGWTVPAGAVKLLSRAMSKAAVSPPDERQRRAWSARKRIEEAFSLDRMVRDVEQIYGECFSAELHFP
ncbi:MAG: glycosyltransferase family 4 protein [Deltaproteobacteria bacterium]|nr:glycosyltransferase family 4 protein [Deltaproteobacteria bacterium]